MSKYNSLRKLYSEIELLESAGLIKAANVLHKKFIKEAQDAFGGLKTQDAKNFMMELDKAYNSGQATYGVMLKAERAGLPPQELQILKDHAKKLTNQAKNDYESKYPNTEWQIANDTVAPARRPYIGNTNLAKSPGLSIGPMDDPSFPSATTSTQAPSGQTDNFVNYYTEQPDTANYYQQQNSNPNAQQESNEQRIYMNALNDIILAFSQNDRNAGEAIFNKTLQQFANPKRKKAFSDQIQRQRTKYFAGKYNQGPTR